MAKPVGPTAAPVGEARPVPWPVAARPELGPMYLAGATPVTVWQDLGIFVSGFVVCALVLGLVGGLTLSGLRLVWQEEPDERLLNVVLLPLLGLAWVGLVAAIVKGRGQSAASLGLVRGRLLVDIPLGLAATGAAFAAFFLALVVIWLCWPAGFAQMQDNQEAITEMLPPVHPAVLCGMQLLVGFYEELVFRGFLLTRLRRALGSWWTAVLISSLLFAVPHMLEQEPVAAIPLFGVGLAFALFTIGRKSVVPAMIGHALFNSIMLMGIYLTNPDWT